MESNQHRRGKSKRIRKEQKTTQSENSKMAITTYIEIIVNIGGLNAPIKTHRVTKCLFFFKKRALHMLLTRDPSGNDTLRLKVKGWKIYFMQTEMKEKVR